MKKLAFILLIIFLTAALEIKSPSAEPERTMPETIPSLIRVAELDDTGRREILGTATSDALEKYAVIKNSDLGKKFIYKKGDYINDELKIARIYDDFLVLEPQGTSDNLILISGMPYKGIEFAETVELKTFEYSYRLIEQSKKVKDNRFELISLKGNKAMLERDYKEEPVDEEQKPSIDEKFFMQLKTKKISEHVWVVDSKSVATPVVDSIQEAITHVAKRVKATGFGKDGIKLGFASKVCTGELDRSGFLVDELSPEVREKAGLLEGDIIKTINGKRVNNIIDLIFLFLDIRSGSVSEVNVALLRDNGLKNLTYIVN